MATTNPSEQVWLKEYETYRSELLVMTKERYTILSIVVTALGIALGFATGTNSEWIVLLIPIIGFVIILPFAYLTYNISEHYHRITAYIEVFIEPNLGLERELAWQIHKREFRHLAFSRPLMLIYAILIFVSGLFPFVYYLAKITTEGKGLFTQNNFLMIVIEAIIGLIIAIIVWIKWGKTDSRTNARDNWEKVKQFMLAKQLKSKKKIQR